MIRRPTMTKSLSSRPVCFKHIRERRGQPRPLVWDARRKGQAPAGRSDIFPLNDVNDIAPASGQGKLGFRTVSPHCKHSGDLALWQTNGGARRDRTDDLMLAKHALSQLSYGPVRGRRTDSRRQKRRSVVCCLSSVIRYWWAWEDSNFRPHAYQARALTN